eukprot:scaffold7983_cov45-Attheya_sp.AAC.2
MDALDGEVGVVEVESVAIEDEGGLVVLNGGISVAHAEKDISQTLQGDGDAGVSGSVDGSPYQ